MSASVTEPGNGGSSGGGVGDWICGDVTCRHLNFARRNQCNKCRRSRSTEPEQGNSSSKARKLGTEIGKVAAEKSRGLFSAEDWQCSKCANVNWARRTTCNMCAQAKVCDVEERTGFGGGYNDRGVVEYKDHVESDSEYDEFGRLKKRKKYSNHSSDMRKQKDKGREEDDGEEDDEEEDDDDDLAKYDLFGDGDDDVPNAANSKSKEANDSSIQKSNKIDSNSSRKRRSRSKTRSDTRRRPSHSSPSSESSSSTSSSSTSSSTTSKSRSKSRSTHRRIRKRSHSLSPSRSSPRRTSVQRHPHRSSSRDKIRHSLDNTKTSSNHGSRSRRVYSSKSRSKSHSSTRSPSSKRNRSRNSSSSRKLSRSPRSHRRRTTRSRSISPKRRR